MGDTDRRTPETIKKTLVDNIAKTIFYAWYSDGFENQTAASKERFIKAAEAVYSFVYEVQDDNNG